MPYLNTNGPVNGKLALVTGPAAEPLTLADAKNFLRLEVSTTAEDDLITSLITAARLECEKRTGRSFINTTWDYTVDYFPPCILLPRSPVSSVTSVKYYDTNNIQQTYSTAAYVVGTGTPGQVEPMPYTIFPTTYPKVGAVVVRFVAGYGADATLVPESVKHAMRLLVAHYYEHREAVIVGTISSELPMAVDSLLQTVDSGLYV